MQLKKIFTALLFGSISLTGYGQAKGLNLKVITAYATKCIELDSIKDSLALYTCNLQIKVKKKNSYIPVISASDTTAFNSIVGLNKLKNFDFKIFMGNENEVKFILPVSVIILDSSYETKKIPAYLNNKIDKLFYYPPENEIVKTIYIPPVIIMIDKKKYN